MNKIQTFQEFLTTQSIEVPVFTFVVNLLLTALLCFILSRIYIRYGSSLSNRRMFARNFVLIGMTTMVIITIVKSSLALSLGLVGALSIVRFRAAIKEPEELSYLFLTIAIGLGLGADQRIITLAALFIICGLIMFYYYVIQRIGTELFWISKCLFDAGRMECCRDEASLHERMYGLGQSNFFEADISVQEIKEKINSSGVNAGAKKYSNLLWEDPDLKESNKKVKKIVIHGFGLEMPTPKIILRFKQGKLISWRHTGESEFKWH